MSLDFQFAPYCNKPNCTNLLTTQTDIKNGICFICIESKPKCKYCESDNHFIFKKHLMCKKCREEYENYLADKADRERKSKTIE